MTPRQRGTVYVAVLLCLPFLFKWFVELGNGGSKPSAASTKFPDPPPQVVAAAQEERRVQFSNPGAACSAVMRACGRDARCSVEDALTATRTCRPDAVQPPMLPIFHAHRASLVAATAKADDDLDTFRVVVGEVRESTPGALAQIDRVTLEAARRESAFVRGKMIRIDGRIVAAERKGVEGWAMSVVTDLGPRVIVVVPRSTVPRDGSRVRVSALVLGRDRTVLDEALFAVGLVDD